MPRPPGRVALAIGLALAFGPPARAEKPEIGPSLSARDKARIAFEAARFGLYLRWGVHALVGKGERVMDRDRLPVGEYEKLPPRFNPVDFDADAWVKAAKDAGARYLTVTAKDFDGFCLFDSKLTRYDVADATPYAKDPLRPIAESCRKHDLPLFFAYALLDWHHPDYAPAGLTGRDAGRGAGGDWSRYVAYYQGQVRELCTNYGPIGGIRFEGLWDRPDADWDLAATYAIIRKLQPGALVVNDHRGAPRADEDARVFDGGLPDDEAVGEGAPPWELVATAGPSAPNDEGSILRLIAGASGRGANLLLTVYPGADGTIPPEAAGRLAEAGRWLSAFGDAVYGTRRGPVAPQPWGVSTLKTGPGHPSALYLHVLAPGAEVRLPASAVALDARVLGTNRLLRLSTEGKQTTVEIPAADRSEVDTVIVLTPKVFDR